MKSSDSSLELGAGFKPIDGVYHHDKVKHSPWIDFEHDLNILPWPFLDNHYELIYAIDVFEHLDIKIIDWMSELYRCLKFDGRAIVRVPAWDNPLSYRDPTHNRVFHEETFDYFDPNKSLYNDFGKFYWKNVPLFKVNFLGKEFNDLKFEFVKEVK